MNAQEFNLWIPPWTFLKFNSEFSLNIQGFHLWIHLEILWNSPDFSLWIFMNFTSEWSGNIQEFKLWKLILLKHPWMVSCIFMYSSSLILTPHSSWSKAFLPSYCFSIQISLLTFCAGGRRAPELGIYWMGGGGDDVHCNLCLHIIFNQTNVNSWKVQWTLFTVHNNNISRVQEEEKRFNPFVPVNPERMSCLLKPLQCQIQNCNILYHWRRWC